MARESFIHSTAVIAADAAIGRGTRIWNDVQVREGVRVGEDCNVGKNVYLDIGVQIGSRVKIQNNCSVYHGAHVEDWAFLGPHVVLTNDKTPRAVTARGELKEDADWTVSGVTIRRGASVGACAVVLPGVCVGAWAVVGAGAVVTRSVPDHGVAVGNPARLVGYVCKCGSVRARRVEELNCECLAGDE